MKRIYIILGILTSILILAVTVGFSYAWYISFEKDEVDLSGASSGAYFYSGDGSEDNPFKIADSRHMYNFVWLQNNGKLNQKYYFELWNPNDEFGRNGNIDMINTVIPPIGNDTYKFLGEFNGNGNIISNLHVSTNYGVIKNGAVLRNSGYLFSNAVGLFAVTAEESIIRNFILNNPIISVSATDTNYSPTADYVVGLAIGYVENKAASIGVLGGELHIDKPNYTTYNSILGSYADGLDVSRPGGTGSGGVTGDGPDGDVGQFIPDTFFKVASNSSNLDYVSSLTSTTLTLKPASWIIPSVSSELGLGSFSFTTHQTSTTVMTQGELSHFYYVPTQIDNNNNADYGLSIASGKLYSAYTGSTKVYLDQAANTTAEQKRIRNLIKDGSTVLDELNYFFDWQNTFSSSSKGASYNVIGEDGSTIESSNLNVYDSVIKVTVKSDNPKIFVIATGVGKRAMAIYKVSDYYGDEINSSINWNYSYFKNNSETDINKNNPAMALVLPQGSGIYTCKNNNCSAKETIFDDSALTCSTCSTKFSKYTSNSSEYVTFACEFDLTGFTKGTYAISPYGGRTRLHYISVEGVTDGDTGGTGGEDTPVTYEISNVDFIYDGVSLVPSMEDELVYSFSVSAGEYSFLDVLIVFTTTGSSNSIYYDRKSEDDEDNDGDSINNELILFVKYRGVIPTKDPADSNNAVIKGL